MSTTPRTLTDHKVNVLNEAISISVDDLPGAGGANHEYTIQGAPDCTDIRPFHISFQNGPIKEVGVNGVSNEALLAVVIDRLRGFQSGPFACRDNDQALARLEEGLAWLQKRTRERMARNVEGTNVA